MLTPKKSLLATTAALAFALSLASCGGSDQTEEPSIDTPPDAIEIAEPAANLAPTDIDSGHVPLDDYHYAQAWFDDFNTSDIWWKDGAEGTEGLYLSNAANDAGRSLTWVDGTGAETASQFNLEVSADNHLVSQDGKEPVVDIVFNDALTCYDYASDTWYVRGDATELAGLLEGLTAETENGKWSVTFSADGTFTEVYDGEEGTGTWEFVTSCNVRLSFDAGSDPTTLDVVRDADGQVIELADSWNHLIVQ